MRLHGKRGGGPGLMLGIVGFVVLVLAVQWSRGSNARPLTEQFAAGPAPSGPALSVPALPTGIAGLARSAVARLAGGNTAPALTPLAQAGSLQVVITELAPGAQGLHIAGEAINTGTAPLLVSLKDFRFTDDTGTTYAAEQGAATTLAPGQRTPLDLSLPLTNPKQLTLEVTLANQPKLAMVLLQTK